VRDCMTFGLNSLMQVQEVYSKALEKSYGHL
jgi:hypothetical protein